MTCRSRSGSPTIASGTSGAMSKISSSPLASAASTSGFSVSAARSRSSNGTDSISSLRDSIFEKSRMLFRMPSSDSADRLTVSR